MKQFKTESKKLLDLMINSIYTNREIFLRELISNASDALDKLAFRALTDNSVSLGSEELEICLSYDAEARTICVSDNGIGMTEAELDKNLGTIAHSGSEQFKADNAEHQGDAIDIIGQFGVGFYSSFMVAQRVRVVSRAYGADKAYAWESDGVQGYSISEAKAGERDGEGNHGTDVTLYLRESTSEDTTDHYLSEWGLKDLVKRYSNYVRHPIRMMVSKHRELPKPEDAGDDYTPQYESYEELETLNSMTPIWKKRSSEVEQTDYNEFYKSSFHDWEDPARTVSFHAEGTLSYDALLFIPSQAPFDLYSKDYEKGLSLYSSNVMIQEKCAELLPDHYNFVRGVVDSADVSLNISRETLQQDAQLRAIAKRVERRITQELETMLKDDREGYEKFFDNFGRALKFGIYESYGARAAELADLLLFWSAKESKMLTLAEYAQAMPEGQEKILYAAGDSKDRVSKLPVVRDALSRGFDVLLCTQDVDEFMLQMMRTYSYTPQPKEADAANGDEALVSDGATADAGGATADTAATTSADTATAAASVSPSDTTDAEPKARELELANVAAADLDLASEEEKTAAEQATKDNAELFEAMKEALEDKVSSVRVSASLSESPARITTEGPISLEMERVMMQAAPDADGSLRAERILELSANHPVFERLAEAHKVGDTDKLKLYSSILYDQALLVEGLEIDDPVEFAKRVCSLM